MAIQRPLQNVAFILKGICLLFNDVWALDGMAKLIDDARSTRDGLRCFATMTLADPGKKSTDNAEAAKAVKESPQFEYLPSSIRCCKAVSNAGGAGLAISEMPAKDTKAAAKLDTLIASLFNIPSRS